ncbi:MAG: ComF family protein [Acidobacteria bacterium]|nr:ComF family protein [Acidobacteriota bacterium]
MLQKIYDSLLSLAYPQSCQICRDSVESSADGAACRQCWLSTRVFTGGETLCAKCSAVLSLEKSAPDQTFCHRCDDHFYDAARAVGLYEKALAASVLFLKTEPFVGRTARALFTAAFENSPFRDATVIFPVPLSKKRARERGFNQAEILAAVLAKEFALEIDRQTLARKIHTPLHRAAMDARARELTVENAFEVTRPKLVENRKILLVDDVFTSGATASACARALRRQGAERVYVMTLARVL